MLSTIIIDDDQVAINRLTKLLISHKNIFNLKGICKTVEDATTITKKIKPDIIFLDVNLNDKTAFDYLKQIEKINFIIVFTTAHKEQAIRAFKFPALDYLIKPISKTDLNDTVSLLKNKLTSKNNIQFKDLLNSLPKKKHQEKISIATEDGYVFLKTADIIHCKSDTNYTHIYSINNDKITSSKTLKVFEEILTDSNFYRIHNSHLININHIKKYTNGKGGYVTMSDDTLLKVSVRKKTNFLKLIINQKLD